ncbi:MAG: peptidoglycan D,D-transpeptidase FtsI family protein [Candidatus Dojkabacteria bacterium]
MRWQIFESEEFIAIANERYRDTKIPSLRGSILAKDGSSLAFSEPRFDAYVWIPELELAERRGYQTQEEFVETISSVLGYKEEDLEKLLESGPLWIKIGDKINVNKRNKLIGTKLRDSERSLQGIQFEYVNRRIYPERRLASHVVGFVGSSTSGSRVGVGGLEQYWEGSLKPQEGFEIGEFDSFGNPITLGDSTPLEPKPGVTLVTTIDKTLQGKLEVNLKRAVEKYESDSATGVIMNPVTGAVMAMASYPNFNPERYFMEQDGAVFGNRAITVPYEIGSVAKIFTVASALDLETLGPTSKVLPNGHKGCEIISPHPKPGASCFNKDDLKDIDCICTYDRKANPNPITLSSAVIDSDNIAFRHIALTMTYEEFYNYLSAFGIGESTEVDLAGESTGLLKPFENWNYADQAVYSYGHSYEITPLQAVTGVAVIANGGNRMQPYLVSQVIDADGKVTDFNPRVVEEVIKPITAETVAEIMHEVFKRNIPENHYQFLDEYYIALKSGTALIPYTDRVGYSDEINTTYVGFDASPEKRFVMLIKLEKPQVGELSFYNAREVWLDTFKDIKGDLGVPKYTK